MSPAHASDPVSSNQSTAASPEAATERFRGWEEEVRRHHEVWRDKAVLRRIYTRWFESMKRSALPGNTLEIGGGFGSLKHHWPEIFASDVVSSPWLDLQADCLQLPFADGTFDNVVGVDVLHHLHDPDLALRELGRVLRTGGRGVFIEPYVSKFSALVRGYFHEETQDLTKDVVYGPDKRPEEANLAIPTRLFKLNRSEFEGRFPGLRVHDVQFSDVLAYPLTGGFGRGNLLPEPMLSVIERMEGLLSPLRSLMGFKMLVVFEAVEQ